MYYFFQVRPQSLIFQVRQKSSTAEKHYGQAPTEAIFANGKVRNAFQVDYEGDIAKLDCNQVTAHDYLQHFSGCSKLAFHTPHTQRLSRISDRTFNNIPTDLQ